MLEINKKQLLSFDNTNKAIILKYITLGLVKYVEENNTTQKTEKI